MATRCNTRRLPMPAMAILRIHIPLTPIHIRSIPTATTEGFWARQSRSASAAAGGAAGDGAAVGGVAAAGDGMEAVGAAGAGAIDRYQGFVPDIPSPCIGICIGITAAGLCTVTCTVTWPASA